MRTQAEVAELKRELEAARVAQRSGRQAMEDLEAADKRVQRARDDALEHEEALHKCQGETRELRKQMAEAGERVLVRQCHLGPVVGTCSPIKSLGPN